MKRQPVKIAASLNIAQSEQLLREIGSIEPGCDLLMPTKLKSHQLGGVSALIQVLITWGKKSPNGRLVTYISDYSGAEEQLINLTNLDHGLVAILRAADVVTRDGKRSCAEKAYELARKKIEAMEAGPDEAQRGPKVFLLCADQTSKAFLPSLYFQTNLPDKDVKGAADFQILARQLLSKTWKFHATSEPIPSGMSKQLGTILHELFENTHLWARTEYDGLRIKRSLRGLRFELHRNSTRELRESAEHSPPLLAYLGHHEVQHPDQMQRFVEISVFDSGPGLAQRMLGRRIAPADSIESEHDAVLHCLALRSTTSHQTHRGVGLHTVMTMLHEVNGFMRLRTGRLNLYRDFLQCPYDREYSAEEPFLLDWQAGTVQAAECPRVEGTLLTMFVPIRFR